MQCFTSKSELIWGELDLPMMGISKDWKSNPLQPPIAFTVATDPSNLWFLVMRTAPAHPAEIAIPHKFSEELWNGDLAELFLKSNNDSSYLELNLAPNAAFWACLFTENRKRSTSQLDFSSVITTYHSEIENGGWLCGLSIPLSTLKECLNFNEETHANACFILNSPNQTFHSATPLPGSEPDFHQAEHFPKLRQIAI